MSLPTNSIVTGDTFKTLPDFPEKSVHTVVTDPPYGLNFMSRSWDQFKPKEYQDWCERWATEVKRVLKPGGHLLAFGSNRTHHRLFSGVEDAGYEIRDTLTWHYGSGFPKALDISKTIDKRKDYTPLQKFRKNLERRRKDAGVSKREIRQHFGIDGRLVTKWMGETDDPQATSPTPDQWRDLREMLGAEDLDTEWQAWRDKVGKPSPDWFDREKVGEYNENRAGSDVLTQQNTGFGSGDRTAPATDAGEKWDGWKTALKPATEFVVLARKPLSEGTVAENVQEWGTGALNIDGCRIESGERPERTHNGGKVFSAGDKDEVSRTADGTTTEGRYPSNVVFDEQAAERLDRDVGELAGGAYTPENWTGRNTSDAPTHNDPDKRTQIDNGGGPSRYFYTSKASRAERTLDGRIANAHPTVKPQDLMKWLVRLVTREGQIVLDPFAGSGTTCAAAKDLGREFVGIEKQPKWADVARVRVGMTPEDPARVRDDDDQQGLEAFTDGGGSDG